MKKLLACLLILSLLAASCTLFSSCISKVSEYNLEEDPQKVIHRSLNTTAQEFFTDDADAVRVIREAMERGALSVEVERTGEGEALKLSETVYRNLPEKQIVSDTALTLGDSEFAARLFMEPDGLILSGETVLGSKRAFSFRLSDVIGLLTEQLPGASDPTNVYGTLPEILDELYEQGFDLPSDEDEENLNRYLAQLDPFIENRTLTDADGRKTRCTSITYTLSNATIRRYMKQMVADMDVEQAEQEQLQAELDATFEKLNRTAAIDLELCLTINRWNAKMELVEIDGTIRTFEQYEEDRRDLTLDADVTFADDRIALVAQLTGGEQPLGLQATLKKEVVNDTYRYKLDLDVTRGSITVEYLNLTYEYAKRTGAISLVADAFETPETRATLAISGKLTVTKSYVNLVLDEIRYNDLAVNWKLSVLFDKTAELPPTPTNVKKLADLTEDEKATVTEEFLAGPLGSLIFSSPDIPDEPEG